jgi:hypothetical protein
MGDSPSKALVFMSHSSADRVIAEAACHSLETAGIQCWIAPRDVKGARFYPSQIVQAIRRSNVFILIFSEAANKSDHVLQELERATAIGIPILAVRLGTVTPSDSFAYFLGVRHWVEPPSAADGTVDFNALPDHVKALIPEQQPRFNQSTEHDLELFGHFRILRREDGSLFRLGKGGMGETFKARDTILDRIVALKVISAGLLGSSSVRERFLREAKAAAKIQHPHVATVFHFGQEGDTYFYAMEFVDGEDLERYVQTRGRLPVPLALRVAHQVAQGLEASAEQKLIHRDIKPSNIMGVWKKDFNIKLIDFGLAKNLDPRSLQESVLSGRGDFLGTVSYASPEQCKAAVLDVRSDIYSLGVTLWYLLAGERPFAGTAGELIGSHLYKSPPFEKLDGVPEPVIALLRRMLQKEPEARPQNPQALQEEIQKISNELANDFADSIKPPEPLRTPTPEPAREELVDSIAVDAPGFISYLTPAEGAELGDDYHLEEEIGEGIGGRLFRVSGPAQARAKLPLVVKLLHPALAQDPAMLSLLGPEIDLLLQARNDHLISYFGFERETPVPFIVREWVHGFPLLDLLRWKGSLLAVEVVGLLSGVPATLDFGAQSGLGLFEFTLRKSFVVCPKTVESARFREFARSEPPGLADCRLKLNPLSLAPLLLRRRGVWIDSTLLPDSRVQSMTQAAAGIEATKGIPLLARMIYELLSGHPYRERGIRSYTPLTAINEAGNAVLRRALLEPTAKTSFANCESFWGAFASSLDLSPKPIPDFVPVEPALPVEAVPNIAPVAQALPVETTSAAAPVPTPAVKTPAGPPPVPASLTAEKPSGLPAAPEGEKLVDSPKKSPASQKRSLKEFPIRIIGVALALVIILLLLSFSVATIVHFQNVAISTPIPTPTPALAGNAAPGRSLNVSFPVQNNTGYTITGLYIAPHGSRNWGQNWLNSSLKNGAKRNINLTPPVAADSWDIMIVFANGDWNNIQYAHGYDLAGFTYLDFTEGEPVYRLKNN